MFQRLERFAVRQRALVLVASAVFVAIGWQSFRSLPIEAFPDVTDPQVEIVGIYPGQSAEEVEKRVTIELERVLAGTPNLIDFRSVSVFGLSLVTLTFKDKTSDFFLRTGARRWVFGGALVLLVGSLFIAKGIGNEFLPELNEGGFYITTTFPSTISLDETKIHTRDIRERLLKSPEVVDVLSHIGRPEAATQAEGSFNAEFFVPLADESKWRPGMDRAKFESELRSSLRSIPAAQHNFSQPITDRVFETISGIIGQVVVKIHGEDLERMTGVAEDVIARLAKVKGWSGTSAKPSFAWP